MMKGGLGGMMKQAQVMQQNMQKAQAELATVEVEGQAGSGMVRVTMTCGHVVRRVVLLFYLAISLPAPPPIAPEVEAKL